MDLHLSTILKLRLLVGFLGERAQYDWWPTGFFGAYSLRSLEFVAPKTALLAQYHGVVEAARRLHDERLSVGSYQLFRLPEEVEQDLHALLQSSQGTAVVNDLPKDKETALKALSEMADPGTGTAEGPIAVGSINSLGSPETAMSIAGVYAKAFLGGVRAYPYLVR